jgi:hypothetical protein
LGCAAIANPALRLNVGDRVGRALQMVDRIDDPDRDDVMRRRQHFLPAQHDGAPDEAGKPVACMRIPGLVVARNREGVEISRPCFERQPERHDPERGLHAAKNQRTSLQTAMPTK